MFESSIFIQEGGQKMEIIRYLICGGLTTIVSIGSFFASTIVIGTGNTLKLQIANIISFICAVLVAYTISRIWVFRKSGKSIRQEFFEFLSCRIITLIMDMGIMQLLVIILGIREIYAKLIVQVIVTMSNYVFSKMIIFKEKK